MVLEAPTRTVTHRMKNRFDWIKIFGKTSNTYDTTAYRQPYGTVIPPSHAGLPTCCALIPCHEATTSTPFITLCRHVSIAIAIEIITTNQFVPVLMTARHVFSSRDCERHGPVLTMCAHTRMHL